MLSIKEIYEWKAIYKWVPEVIHKRKLETWFSIGQTCSSSSLQQNKFWKHIQQIKNGVGTDYLLLFKNGCYRKWYKRHMARRSNLRNWNVNLMVKIKLTQLKLKLHLYRTGCQFRYLYPAFYVHLCSIISSITISI